LFKGIKIMRLKRSNERLAGMGVVVVELGRIW